MLNMAGDGSEPEQIDPAHLGDVLESLAQAKRREFATDAEVETAFRRFDRWSFARACRRRSRGSAGHTP
jgi:hypothetical protein